MRSIGLRKRCGQIGSASSVRSIGLNQRRGRIGELWGPRVEEGDLRRTGEVIGWAARRPRAEALDKGVGEDGGMWWPEDPTVRSSSSLSLATGKRPVSHLLPVAYVCECVTGTLLACRTARLARRSISSLLPSRRARGMRRISQV